MWSSALLLALLPAAAVAQSSIDINVGKTGLVFDPAVVHAAVGDTLVFHFYPGDHSVAQSTYSKPCVPSGSNAIYSGFLNPSSGVDSMEWSVTVNNTQPLWLYCTQISHCQQGMVMVVNPPKSGDTITKYANAAKNVGTSVSPSKVEGGVFSANKKASNKPSTGSSPLPAGIGSSNSNEQISTLRKAHGAIMAVTVVLLLPIGALSVRLLSFRGLVWFHAGWQMLSLFLLTAGFGIGVHQAQTLAILYKGLGSTHTLFGTVVFALFWLQPLLGLAHHLMFKKKHARTPVSYAHIFYGRILFILAIINGGLGIKLVQDLGGPANTGGAANTNSVLIAYAVVAGVVGVAYIGLTAFGEMRRAKKGAADSSNGVGVEK